MCLDDFKVDRDEATDGVAKNSQPLMSFQWLPLWCSIDIELLLIRPRRSDVTWPTYTTCGACFATREICHLEDYQL